MGVRSLAPLLALPLVAGLASACFTETTTVVIERPPGEETKAIERVGPKLGWQITSRDASSLCLDSGVSFAGVICFSEAYGVAGRTQAVCIDHPPARQCKLAIDEVVNAAGWQPIP